MSNVNETGHSVNVNHFLELKTIAMSLGRSYSPATPLIQLDSLESLYASCKTANDGLAVPLVTWKDKVSNRQSVMNPLNKLVTRVLRALKVSGASDEAIIQASSFARKIQGITLTSLQTLLANMESTNAAVIAAETALTRARQHRNDLLYSPVTGLTAIAQSIKDETTAVFVFGSPVHKQVVHIKFTNPRQIGFDNIF